MFDNKNKKKNMGDLSSISYLWEHPRLDLRDKSILVSDDRIKIWNMILLEITSLRVEISCRALR